MSQGRTLAPLAVLVVSLATAAAAQEITGTITGTVTDQTGAVLPGASVSAKDRGTGLAKETTTGGKGTYTLSFLPVGTYDVTFSLAGFRSFVARDVPLHVNDRLPVNATLTLSGAAEVLEVTAAARLVQPTAAVQSLMGRTQVQELPLNNRNFVQLATLVPGVSSDLDDEVGIGLTSRVSISVNGTRRNAVNWLVDGASNVDVGSNITLLSTPTLESIEEFKIITSSYAAEWPRSGGGIVNVVTRSGTNAFRASAYEFFRNDALNANSFFRNLSANPAVAEKPPRLRYNNFGYTLGGPLRKDKLFFFWSQEWRRITRAPASVTATVPDPAWLTDPTSPNYVSPAERDPAAVSLLSAWPAPNVPGTNRYVSSQPNVNDTRQEVVRLDYMLSPKWRFMARYTHDLSQTTEAGGLFFGVAVPNVATTETDVPGRVAVAQVVTTIGSRSVNEFTYQFSSNDIGTVNPAGTRNRKSDYAIQTSELFPENNGGFIPIVRVSGLSTIGSNQLYTVEYRNHTFADNFTMQRGDHALKFGALVTFEQKNESALAVTQGDFTFATGGGRSAFQNFLRGNRDGRCGTPCSYTETEKDLFVELRFNRYEFYAQDSWRVRPGLTLDLGLRYAIYPGVTERSDILTSFDPALYDPAQAPTLTSGGTVVAGTGDPLNGIVMAGRNSPGGRALYKTDFGNFQPRLGFTWSPRKDGKTLLRGGFGIYYDQALVGIFEQNAFVNPPFANSVTVQNPSLANPGSGTAPGTRGVRNLIASSSPFATPRTMQWNVGVTRQLYRRGVVELAYAGTAGDDLIRPVDINQPQPADVLRLGNANLARPYPGYGSVNMRETTARSRYHGLLFNFRHDAGHAGLLNVAYTLSRAETDATNDRDSIDLPQNPLDMQAEYALARTDRTHVLTLNWVYELPFFKRAEGFLKAALGGWQVSGIWTAQSGPPLPFVSVSTNGLRRGNRATQVGDPLANVPPSPADRRGVIYWFNPAAFQPNADGSYGNSERAPLRLPGRNQWDITLSKNWYPTKGTRLQFRADFINALNHTQYLGVDRACGVSLATCVLATDTFATVTSTRAPREIQLGLKFYWN